MNKTRAKLHIRALSLIGAILYTGQLAHADARTLHYGITAAQEEGINLVLGKYDPGVIKTTSPISNIVVTLPSLVDANYSGNMVFVMSKVSSGRAPIIVVMQDGTTARINVIGAPTRGDSINVELVDDRPKVVGAKEYVEAPTITPAAAGAPITNAAPAGSAGLLTLPAPSTVRMELARDGATLNVVVHNDSAQTLSLAPGSLNLRVAGQAVAVPATFGGTLAPGLSATYALGGAGSTGGPVEAAWNVVVPGLRASFTLAGALAK